MNSNLITAYKLNKANTIIINIISVLTILIILLSTLFMGGIAELIESITSVIENDSTGLGAILAIFTTFIGGALVAIFIIAITCLLVFAVIQDIIFVISSRYKKQHKDKQLKTVLTIETIYDIILALGIILLSIGDANIIYGIIAVTILILSIISILKLCQK